MYSVSEIPSKRPLASQVVLCEEHSLAPMVDSEYGVNVCIDSADERRCVVSCTSDCSIKEDPAVEQFLDVWRYSQMRAAGVRRLKPWQFSRVKSCLSGYVAIPCMSGWDSSQVLAAGWHWSVIRRLGGCCAHLRRCWSW